MSRILTGWLLVFLSASAASAQLSNRVAYTLLEGSSFLDQCLVCGRPDILQPMGGRFELLLLQNTPPFTKYAVENVDFDTSPGWLERHLQGDGVYTRFEEFAILQNMYLALQVKDKYTNLLAFFTNDNRAVPKPFPLIEADLTQSNGTWLQTFSLHLLAAPVREIWFSTRRGFTSTNRFAPTNQVSAGDLISNRGRVVKRNIDLAGRLGIMPIVPDLGLDAIQVTGRGEILFSIPGNVFSESLGPLHNGDVLSSRGAVVRRNQQLLAAFHPLSTNDAGLDAMQVLPGGEILFSIATNVSYPASSLGRGDVLSDQGRVFLTHQQLLERFHPTVSGQDFGLDALAVLPWGEIWFSVEQSFIDAQLGQVQEGDLLSNFGYRVFSNQALLSGFAPSDASADYGLDALFVVTDTRPSRAPPRLVQSTRTGAVLRLQWDGDGDVFQVESAPALAGPWSTCGEIVPDLSADLMIDSTYRAAFYRLRQW
jgi:hypothetical protein